MYVKLNDNELDRLKRISKETGIDYEATGEFVPVGKVVSALFDLYCEYMNKADKLEETEFELKRKEKALKEKEAHCNEFHVERKIDPYEEYGISRKDFI